MATARAAIDILQDKQGVQRFREQRKDWKLQKQSPPLPCNKTPAEVELGLAQPEMLPVLWPPRAEMQLGRAGCARGAGISRERSPEVSHSLEGHMATVPLCPGRSRRATTSQLDSTACHLNHLKRVSAQSVHWVCPPFIHNPSFGTNLPNRRAQREGLLALNYRFILELWSGLGRKGP